MTTDGDELPNPSSIVRYVPYARMRRDEDDENYLGPLPAAFERRQGEEYLSVTWCEYFEGEADAQLRCAIEAIRNSNLTAKPKACFCVAKTPNLLEAIMDAGNAGRVLFHPEDDNEAHAGVYGIAPEEAQLLAQLADEVWCSFFTKKDADDLPFGDCIKSAGVE